MNDEDFAQEEKLYIPTLGKEELTSSRTFDLEAMAHKFLQDETSKVLLLLGDSGSGKSLFGQYLVKQLWLQNHYLTRIPLFIELASLSDPVHSVIEESFTRRGFSPTEIAKLKETHQFLFILDGYDETKSTQNFYLTNKLHLWNAKILFTCRTQYLKDSHSKSWFKPPSQNRNNNNDQSGFQELFVAPFPVESIDAYLQKYIEVKKPVWKHVEEYRTHIYRIPGLRFLVTNPFILKIIAQELPRIVYEHEQKRSEATEQAKQLELERYDIYSAFVRSWFERQENKLMQIGSLPCSNIKDLFASFSKELAYEMFDRNVTHVRYVAPDSALFVTQETSPWERFFGNRDPLISTSRTGCPLRKTALDTWAFLHMELQDYFVSRYMYEDARRVMREMQLVSTQGLTMAAQSLSPKMQSRTKIGGKYYLIDKLDQREGAAIYQQSGYVIAFAPQVLETPVNLGVGRYGVVGLAYREEKQEYVAFKKVQGKEEVAQSRQEAELQHFARGEGVLEIYNTVLFEEGLYHFMPLAKADGRVLQQRLRFQEPAQRIFFASHAARDLFTGLRTLHRKRVYHLDLKPENTLIDKAGKVLITDFGCGKFLVDGLLTEQSDADIAYCAPERVHFQAGILAEKVDMYAAGVTIAEWYLGLHPAKYGSRANLLEQLKNSPEIPADVIELIHKLLAVDPKERPTVQEALQTPALEHLAPLTMEQIVTLYEEPIQITLVAPKGNHYLQMIR